MKKLDPKTAQQLSKLINSLTLDFQRVERASNSDEQTIQAMKWHDQTCDKLAEFGISVARYNWKETA